MSNQEGDEQQLPPAVYSHAVSVYGRMFEQCKLVVPSDGTKEMAVWEGSLVDLITKQLYLSTPYYTSVTRLLKAMGCVKQLKRGGGSGLSQWELISQPTEEKYWEIEHGDAPVTPRQWVPRAEFEALEQRHKDLLEKVMTHEEYLQAILKFIRNGELPPAFPEAETTGGE
jgi:hypothetical protein